jgi:alpha-glucosidase
LDAVHTINANSVHYKDNPPNSNFKLGPLPQDQQPFFRQLHDAAQLNQPAIQEFCTSYRKIADSYPNDRFLMGEVDGDNDTAMSVSENFTNPGRLHATYNFDLLEWAGLTVTEIREAILKAAQIFNNTGRLSFAFSNHDVPRVATRQLEALGVSVKDSDRMQILLLKLQISIIGSSCIYQGEELGLEDVRDIPKEKMQDPWGIEFAPTFLGRDTCRTPMVWNKKLPNGGFSKANKTWLPIADQHLSRAAIDSASDPKSIYNELSKFLKWRKKQSAMMTANCILNITGDHNEISFDRQSDDQTLRCHFDFDTLTASFQEI